MIKHNITYYLIYNRFFCYEHIKIMQQKYMRIFLKFKKDMHMQSSNTFINHI